LILIERQLALNYVVRAPFNRSIFWRLIAHITGSARPPGTIAATFLPAPADSLYARLRRASPDGAIIWGGKTMTTYIALFKLADAGIKAATPARRR
jgi:hypothetical protein